MKVRGFTLLELLITVALAAILLAIAAPSFTTIIRNNAMGSARDSLYNAIQYARTEAVSRNTHVSICAAADANFDSCADVDDWAVNGWVVFVDSNTGTGMAFDTTLRVYEPITGIEVRSNGADHFQYQPSGLLTSSVDGATVSFCDVDGNATERSLIVANITGQIRTGDDSDATCP